MRNKNKGWFIALSIIGYILTVCYCFTLVFIPIAIYCYIGAKKYSSLAEMSDVEVARHDKSITNWAIFFSIVGFPIGLISIIPAILVGNNVTVSDIKSDKEPQGFSAQTVQETEKREPVKNELSDLETLEKLKKLLDEGLITQEEYERAKSDLFKD